MATKSMPGRQTGLTGTNLLLLIFGAVVIIALSMLGSWAFFTWFQGDQEPPPPKEETDKIIVEVLHGFRGAPDNSCIGPKNPLSLAYRVYVDDELVGGERGLHGKVDFLSIDIGLGLNPIQAQLEKDGDGRTTLDVTYVDQDGTTYLKAVYTVPTTGEQFESRTPNYEVNGEC